MDRMSAVPQYSILEAISGLYRYFARKKPGKKNCQKIASEVKKNSNKDSYRLGDTWSRIKVTKKLTSTSPLIRQASLSIVKTIATTFQNTASAIYLGKINGQHIVATNSHVCNHASGCREMMFVMKAPNGRNILGRRKKLLGIWKKFDFALVAIELFDKKEEKLLPKGLKIDASSSIYPGQKLITMGFGNRRNPKQHLTVNMDRDCKVLSQRDHFPLTTDPDNLNSPSAYKVHSFAHGCDISGGDSGSPVIDRVTGRVVGINWSAKLPRSSRLQRSSYLQCITGTNHKDIWQQLSYAVPFIAVKKHLFSRHAMSRMDAETRAIVKKLFNYIGTF
ncbi:MAG: serine protease [Pseudomonadota bacterium]